jgi:glycosyltransferase involved in cell wall biosynthesis
MPTITIVIPTYNRANLVGQALRSVFSQTYRDFEVIVVDDGSTDDTVDVLQPLVEQGLIRYVYQKNQGESAARNRGIAEAKGQYIAFLDSDDLFEPTKLEIQLQYLRDHSEVGLVHSGFTKFENNNDDLGYRDTSWFSGMIYPQILLYWTTLIPPSTVLIPKNIFEVVGLFDNSLRIGPDLDMWRRIARKYPFGSINKSLTRIRVHTGNISGDKIEMPVEFIKYLDKAFVDDPGLTDRFKKRSFSRMFSAMALNLLSEKGDGALHALRLNVKRAIVNDPRNSNAYFAGVLSLFGYDFRYFLIRRWRSLRSLLMSRNRSI